VGAQHLNANRVWALIRDGRAFTSLETAYVEACINCHDWITTFAKMAEKSGFEISFVIPALRKKAELA